MRFFYATVTILLFTLSQQGLAQEQDPAPTPSPQASPALPPEQGGRLELICMGGGSANKVAVARGRGNSSFSGSAIGPGGMTTFSGSGSSSSTIYIPTAQAFDDQMDLFIEKGEGRIRMPRVMLPLIRGGENGWFKLKNVEFGSSAITASVAINIINNPKLRIDRRTRVVNLSGKAGDFVGRCQLAPFSQADEAQHFATSLAPAPASPTVPVVATAAPMYAYPSNQGYSQGPAKRPARSPSGFCYDVPKSYAGTGSVSKPAITSATPACYELLEK